MEADRKRAAEDNAKFQELKSRYFGLAMTDGELEIRTLDTIEDYYMVGESQHHMRGDCKILPQIR